MPSQQEFFNQQMAEIASQRREELLNSAPQQRGIFGAMALGRLAAERREARAREADSRIYNEELQTAIGSAQPGEEIDMAGAAQNALFAAANRIARTGGPGSATRARELYQQAMAMQVERQSSALNALKTESEITENIAQAEEAGQPKDEFIRLQNEREMLREIAGQQEPGGAAHSSLLGRITEIDARLKYMSEHVGRTEFDVAARTKGDLENRVIAGAERIARLQEIADSFDPGLLTIDSKMDTALASLANRFGISSAEQQAKLDAWVDLSQSATRDLNSLLRELSGVAVTPQEAERQLLVLPNPGTASNPFSGDAPAVFQRKLRNEIQWAQAAERRYVMLLTRGLLAPDSPITEALASQYPVDLFMPAAPAAEAAGNGLPPGVTVRAIE